MIIPLDDRSSFKIPGVVVQIFDVKHTNQQIDMLLVGSAGNVITGRSLWSCVLIISLPAGKEKIQRKKNEPNINFHHSEPTRRDQMKISEAFPSKFLKADDLSGKIAVTINDVGQEAMGMDKTLKLILYFRELDKPMVCNHTNGDMIAQLHGDETDNWVGKRIVLTRALVPFQGKNVPAVRVCDFIPGQKKAAPPPPEEPVGELDFVEADQAMVDL